MHLLIDSGNTRTKLTLSQPTQEQTLSITAIPREQLDSLPAFLSTLPALDGVLGCNVAGAATAAAIEKYVAAAGYSINWKTPLRECLGVTTHYEDLSQLGPDRWLSVIAASARITKSALVINAGTALTVDAITATKQYLGGTICPGWSLMRDALAQHTARLGRPDGDWRPFPATTANAIISGITNALVGSIEQLAKELSAHGEIEACLLSGGDAHVVAPRLSYPVLLVDNLVLRGLAALTVAGFGDE